MSVLWLMEAGHELLASILNIQSVVCVESRGPRISSSSDMRTPVQAADLCQHHSRHQSKVLMSFTEVPVISEMWGMEVVKEGYLFVKRPPGHKWNKIRVSFDVF